MKKKLILSAAFAFAVVGFSPAVGATGDVDQNIEHKVEICHRDNNVKKPYGPSRIEVDEAAVDGAGPGDHYKKHQGPLASSKAVAQQLKDNHTKWGDIIPPTEAQPSGLNWTAEGQAIYNNDCQYVEEPEEPETPVTPETPNNPVTPQSTTTEEETPQVEAPASGVNAGSGDVATIATAVVTLIGSVASLAYGVVRFTKFGS